jgi:hypothetical protein
MAVTISEMHVDVQEAAPAGAAPAKGAAEPKKDASLGQALEILRERESRLRAD